ncbi:MAG: hypothetical protein ACREFE_13095 [Limisphaerales bacterium]
MKKLTPYILAYLIVATCTAVYPYIYRHVFMSSMTEVMPHGSVAVVLNPGMSHDDLVAKLQQVGLSEAQAQHAPIVRPAPVLTAVFRLVYHYAFDAVIFAAFAGLVILFQRKFCANVPDHDHAA